MKNKIYLATTVGCKACEIMSNILNNFHKDNINIFDLEIVDFKKLPDFIKLDVPFNDFPTTIFIKNNVIKYHYKGTMSIRKLERLIQDLHFN